MQLAKPVISCILDIMAERRIREAQENGVFDGLPGAGAPLALDDDTMVPEELRVAYRMLKNAGFVPAELEAHREIRELEQLLQRADDDGERGHLLARINFLLQRGAVGRRGFNLRVESAYFEKIAEKLMSRPVPGPAASPAIKSPAPGRPIRRSCG